MSVPDERQRLRDALAELAATARACRLELSAGDGSEQRAIRDRLAARVDEHVTRLRDLDAPLLVVVGGVTGAGKSTFVNTLAGRVVAATGAVRPTTRAPVLLCSPQDRRWFEGDRVLPELPRIRGGAGPAGGVEGSGLRLVDADLPPGLALVDAPDVDSVSAANRRLGRALLDAADLWLYFTESRKYADADSMQPLRRAATRDTAVAVVLGQVRDVDRSEVTEHFREMLDQAGLAHAPLFVIPDVRVETQDGARRRAGAQLGGMLPPEAVALLAQWLQDQAQTQARTATVLRTLSGALTALPGEVEVLAGVVEDQAERAARLRDAAGHAYGRARERLAAQLGEGLSLRQEVLERWRELVGGGTWLQRFLSGALGVRERARLLGRRLASDEARQADAQVRASLAEQLVALTAREARAAAADTVAAWADDPDGRELLGEDRDELAGAGPQVADGAAEAVTAWQEHVTALVGTVGAERRTRARWLSYGLNGIGTMLMLAVLTATGGVLTGAETGVAAATLAGNQVLLGWLFGQHNLSRLTADAREDLLARLSALLDEDCRRFTARVDAAAPDPDDAAALRAAAAKVGALHA